MTAFDEKSQGMRDLLNQLYPISDAQKLGICSVCMGPATEFSTELYEYEYGISGLCESCQDIVFNQFESDEDDWGYGE